MTKNQEKELFNILGTLVTGVRGIKTDVQELITDVQELKSVQKEHSQILKRLDAKTESIAEVVLRNDGRLTSLEKEVEDLRGGVH